MDEVLLKIRALRTTGEVNGGIISQPARIEDLADAFRLTSSPGSYHQITSEAAREIAIEVLHRDLAYESKLMTVEEARELAQAFLAIFQAEDVRFYTNSLWERTDGRLRLVSWIPVTRATFDTGVLVLGSSISGCLWVADED